ncbi:MAG: peptidylprolyl isomerase [Acidobacteriota bacterium]
MKKTLLSISLMTLVCGTLFAGEVVEAVIARVGDRIITRSQYLQRLREGTEEIEHNIPPDQVKAKKEDFQKTLLTDMLNELLLKDRADRLGLTVTPKEVEEAVGRLREQYGIKTDKEFNESLQKSGMTRADMENRLRDTILTNKVFGRELRSRSELTDRELRERYDREKDQYRLPERATLREIIILVPADADAAAEQAATAKADKAVTEAKGGADFAKLAEEYSEAPSKSSGGQLGTVAKGELLPDLDSAVFASQPGAVIGPIKTRSGLHILKVEERLPSEVPGFDSVKDKLRKQVDEETFQRDLKAYLERLRKEAFVQINDAQVPTTL